MAAEKKRLQFDFTQDALEELDEMQRVTRMPNRAELIRYALRFLQWAVEQTSNNRATLLLEKNGRIREVVFPFWAQTLDEASSESNDKSPENQDEGTKALAAFSHN